MRVECPECGNIAELPESAAGKNVRCGTCETVFEVPDSEEDDLALQMPEEEVEPEPRPNRRKFRTTKSLPVRPKRGSGGTRRPTRTRRRRPRPEYDYAEEYEDGGNKPTVWGVLGVILVCVFLFVKFSGKNSTGGSKPSGTSVSKSSSYGSDEVKLAAKNVVYDNLKAPATARWVSTTILEEKPPKYIVSVVVDAQNGFGALIRSRFLCCVEIVDAENYRHKKGMSVYECKGQPSSDEMQLFKNLNGW